MKSPSRARRPSPATAISVTALVFAMAGGAVAVSGDTIDAGTIQSSKLANGAVTSPKIRAGAVTTNAIRSAAVTSSKLADGSVTSNAIAASAISTADIANGAVTRGKIRAGAITGKLVASGTLSSTNIVPAGIGRASLAADARIPAVVTRFVVATVPINTTQAVQSSCLAGETATGGGFAGLPATIQGGGTQANVLASRPEPLAQGIRPTGWFVLVDNKSTSLAEVSVYALCATAA